MSCDIWNSDKKETGRARTTSPLRQVTAPNTAAIGEVMSDRFFFPLAIAAYAVLIVLSLSWPQAGAL